MTLSAVGKQCLSRLGCRRYHGVHREAPHERRDVAIVDIVAASALQCRAVSGVACVTPQAQEGRRLQQEVVGNRSVRFVTDRTALCHRSMFPHKGSFLFAVTLETQLVERLGRQALIVFAMGIMTI